MMVSMTDCSLFKAFSGQVALIGLHETKNGASPRSSIFNDGPHHQDSEERLILHCMGVGFFFTSYMILV